jgi:hypothetical protein
MTLGLVLTPRRPRGAGGEEGQAGEARCPSPPQTLSLREKSAVKGIVLLDWLPPIISASAENRGNSCQRKHPAEILALGSSCASQRRSSNANSLCRQIWLDSLEIYATFQRDILRTLLSSSPPTPAMQSGLYQPTCRLDLNSWRHLVIRRPSTKNRCPSPGAAPLGFSGPCHRGPTLLDRATKRDSGAKPRDRRTGEPAKQRICHHLTVTNV